MKNQIIYTIVLVVVGACLGFFGLVYWNFSARISQAQTIENQAGGKLQAVDEFLQKAFSEPAK